MSKGRLITALILAALTCAGCGGKPTAQTGSQADSLDGMQAKHEFEAAREALHAAAPDELAAYEKAMEIYTNGLTETLLEAAFSDSEAAHEAYESTRLLYAKAMGSSIEEADTAPLIEAGLKAPAERLASAKAAWGTLKAAAPVEAAAYAKAEAAFMKAHVKAQDDWLQAEEEQEAAWEALKSAAPDELAAYEKAKELYENGLREALEEAMGTWGASVTVNMILEKAQAWSIKNPDAPALIPEGMKADAMRLASAKAALKALKETAPDEWAALETAEAAQEKAWEAWEALTTDPSEQEPEEWRALLNAAPDEFLWYLKARTAFHEASYALDEAARIKRDAAYKDVLRKAAADRKASAKGPFEWAASKWAAFKKAKAALAAKAPDEWSAFEKSSIKADYKTGQAAVAALDAAAPDEVAKVRKALIELEDALYEPRPMRESERQTPTEGSVQVQTKPPIRRQRRSFPPTPPRLADSVPNLRYAIPLPMDAKHLLLYETPHSKVAAPDEWAAKEKAEAEFKKAKAALATKAPDEWAAAEKAREVELRAREAERARRQSQREAEAKAAFEKAMQETKRTGESDE